MSPFLVAAALVAQLASSAVPRIAVLDVKSLPGVPAELGQGLSDSVAVEVRKRAPNYAVVSSDEIRSLLALEKQKQQLGCDTVSCLSEIGGALGAQQMVTGSLALFGDLYVLTLKRVDVVHATVTREASGRIEKGREREMPDLVERLCKSLFSDIVTVDPDGIALTSADPFEQAERDSPSTIRHSHPLGWTLIAVAVALGGTAIGTGIAFGSDAGDINGVNNGNANHVGSASAYNELSTARAFEGVAIATGVAAILAAGGAVIAW